MLPPSDWYAKQDLSQHYMRDTSRPFEEGVSRGNKRVMFNYVVDQSDIDACYPIIIENRAKKGRNYGMAYKDLWDIEQFTRCFIIGDIAAAICVIVAPTVLYTSAWGHVAGDSPVVSLCREIYNWCAANGFSTLDIGIGGDPNLDAFKERLGFRRAA
jgi:hypothetical protein